MRLLNTLVLIRFESVLKSKCELDTLLEFISSRAVGTMPLPKRKVLTNLGHCNKESDVLD